MKTRLIAAYLFLLLCFAAHVFEEAWGRTWLVKYFGVKTFLTLNGVLLLISLVLFLFAIMGGVWARRLSIIYALIMIANGLWHNIVLAMTRRYFEGYAVGSNTGIGLIVAGVLLIHYLRETSGQIPHDRT
jgi:hypothetical protein